MPADGATSDVVVVGAGVIGMFAAWQLARRGASVTVVERVGVGSGATAVQPGGVRTQWSSPDTCALACESKAFYDVLDDVLEPSVSPAFDPCGYSFLASTEESMNALADGVARQNALGIGSVTLTPGDIAELVPGIDSELLVGGAYNAGDGYFDRPLAVVAAVAEAARRLGVQVVIGEVVSVTASGGGWNVACRDGTRHLGARVVVAAGADSAPILQTVGVDLPLRSEPRYLFYSNPIPPFLVRPLCVFQDEHFAVKHLADGSVLASDLTLGRAGALDEAGWRRHVTQTARRLAPLLEHVRYPVMATGSYDVTPDAQLLVGPVDEHHDLVVACGMNGRGLMLAPSVGRMVADAVLEPRSDTIPAGLLPARFEHGLQSAGERQVI